MEKKPNGLKDEWWGGGIPQVQTIRLNGWLWSTNGQFTPDSSKKSF